MDRTAGFKQEVRENVSLFKEKERKEERQREKKGDDRKQPETLPNITEIGRQRCGEMKNLDNTAGFKQEARESVSLSDTEEKERKEGRQRERDINEKIVLDRKQLEISETAKEIGWQKDGEMKKMYNTARFKQKKARKKISLSEEEERKEDQPQREKKVDEKISLRAKQLEKVETAKKSGGQGGREMKKMDNKTGFKHEARKKMSLSEEEGWEERKVEEEIVIDRKQFKSIEIGKERENSSLIGTQQSILKRGVYRNSTSNLKHKKSIALLKSVPNKLFLFIFSLCIFFIAGIFRNLNSIYLYKDSLGSSISNGLYPEENKIGAVIDKGVNDTVNKPGKMMSKAAEKEAQNVQNSKRRATISMNNNSVNRRRRRRRLEFVHIPKTGGTVIESAAANHGIVWAVCHFGIPKNIIRISLNATHCPSYGLKYDWPRAKKYHMVPWWHLPPQYILDMPPGNSLRKNGNNPYYGKDDDEVVDLFVVVRNVYDRIVSEYYYYMKYVVEKGNGIKNVNEIHSLARFYNFLDSKLNEIQKGRRGDITKRNLEGAGEYFLDAGHWIPQYDYIYSDDTSNRTKIVKHVLRFENLATEFPALMAQYNMSHIVLPSKQHRSSTSLFSSNTTAADTKLSVYNMTRKQVLWIENLYWNDIVEFQYPVMSQIISSKTFDRNWKLYWQAVKKK